MQTKFKNPNQIEYRFPKQYICGYCSGDGYTEYISCNAPVSDCCGGCYKKEICDECDGEGYITIEKSMEDLIKKYKKNRNRCINYK